MFSGLMSYYPNQQGIRWFLDEIFFRSSRAAHRTRASSSRARRRQPGFGRARRLTWRSPAAFPTSVPTCGRRVVVVPLRIGGGTRVKILEAQAMRRPVVSTTIGAEGLGLSHGESILLADRAQEFADRVVDLFERCLAGHGDRGHRHGRTPPAISAWTDIGERLSAVLQPSIGLTPRRDPLPEQHTSRWLDVDPHGLPPLPHQPSPVRPTRATGARCDDCRLYDPVAERILIVKLDAPSAMCCGRRHVWSRSKRNIRTAISPGSPEPARQTCCEETRESIAVLTRSNRTIWSLILAEDFDLAIGPDTDHLSATIMRLARASSRRDLIADNRRGVIPLNHAAQQWWEMGLDDAPAPESPDLR